MLRPASLALVSALLVTMTSASASAQALERVGVKVGGALARINYSGGDNENAQDLAESLNDGIDDKVGFSIGAQALLGINANVALQPELLYTSKGSSSSISIFGIESTTTSNFNYLQLPVLVALRLPQSGGLTPKLLLGPYLAYKISGESVTVSGDTEIRNAHDDDEDSAYNPFDAGATLGVGADVDLDGFALGVELRYELGLTGIFETDGDLNATHSQLGLMVGVWF